MELIRKANLWTRVFFFWGGAAPTCSKCWGVPDIRSHSGHWTALSWGVHRQPQVLGFVESVGVDLFCILFLGMGGQSEKGWLLHVIAQ